MSHCSAEAKGTECGETERKRWIDGGRERETRQESDNLKCHSKYAQDKMFVVVARRVGEQKLPWQTS